MNFIKKIKEAIEKTNLDNGAFEAIFSLDGANCSSCAYAIEKVSVKFEGVSYCYVDAVRQKISIHYDGRKSSDEKIIELVRQLGYTAVLEKKYARENKDQ